MCVVSYQSSFLPLLFMLLLHDPDGIDVAVNSDHITTLRMPRGSEIKTFTDKANCLISTNDGKFVTVRETCADVLKLLEFTR